MNMPDVPVQVEVDPNEDTEWNDILRKHKIIPEKAPDRSAEIEAALVQARELAHEHRLEGKDLNELDELEDLEDDDFLDSYRQKRLAEMATLQQTSVFNQVYPLQKPDYAAEVTDASRAAFVLVLLTSSSGENTESKLMVGIWRELAARFGDVKFAQMRADLCIEGYPDRNTPTVLAYRDGEIRRQLVTLKELRGEGTDVKDWEAVLVQLGAVKIGDTRLSKREEEPEEKKSGIRDGKVGKRGNGDESDSDWD